MDYGVCEKRNYFCLGWVTALSTGGFHGSLALGGRVGLGCPPGIQSFRCRGFLLSFLPNMLPNMATFLSDREMCVCTMERRQASHMFFLIFRARSSKSWCASLAAVAWPPRAPSAVVKWKIGLRASWAIGTRLL